MTTDVKIDPPVSPGTEPATPPVPPVTPPVKPGEKTDSALLLESLKEEREKRRTAEADLTALRTELASGNTLTVEEGKDLKTQIATLEGTIASMRAAEVQKDLEAKFPVLKEKASEFAEFRKNYPPGNDESIAKIFLAENNLLDLPITRKGLEKPAGGGRTTASGRMTLADIDNLRQNNYRKYVELLKQGAFKDINE